MQSEAVLKKNCWSQNSSDYILPADQDVTGQNDAMHRHVAFLFTRKKTRSHVRVRIPLSPNLYVAIHKALFKEKVNTRVAVGARSRRSSGSCPMSASNTGDSLSDSTSRATSKARKETPKAASDMRRFPSGSRPLREPIASPSAKDVRRLQPAMLCARCPSRQTRVCQTCEDD